MRENIGWSGAVEERRKGWMRCLRRRIKYTAWMLQLRENERLERRAHAVASLPPTQGSVEPDFGLTTP